MKYLLAATIWISMAWFGFADDRTSANHPKLAEIFKRFPAADADRDGVLTYQEAMAFRKQARAGRQAANSEPTDADVRYGSHPRNVLDFYRAESQSPTPVLIYFHGGGFVAGDKSKARNNSLVAKVLANGISAVSANYRFVRGEHSEPFPGSLMDGARVIQFVRFKAEEWNLDPGKVVLSGGSAGACMSIWLALHDDFADPDNEDPVARFSTRVAGVISYGGQSTLDPVIIVKHIPGNPDIHPSLPPAYGVESVSDLETPEMRAKVEEFSSLNHATVDDPPLLLKYSIGLDDPKYDIHHSKFGRLLLEKYQEIGHSGPIKLDCPGGPDFRTDELDFLLGLLEMQRSGSS